MMHVWKKLLSALLALAMLLPLMGASAEETLAAYGVCTGNQINVRKQIGGAVWFKVDAGHVAQILGTQTDDNGDLWYKIESPHPAPNGRTYTGYIMGAYFRPMTEEELQAYLGTEASALTADATDGAESEATITTGMVTADNVKLRAAAGLDASYYGELPLGTVVEILTIPAVIDDDHWYQVRYNNRVGYIQSPFIRVLTVSEDDLPEVSKYGYAKLISENKVNLRDAAGGETVTQWSGKGSLMRIVGEAQLSGLYSWYPVYHAERGTILYVREDMIEVVSVGGGSVVSRSAEWSGIYGYVITTRGDVNLRINPAEDCIARVPRNTVMPCVGPTVEQAMGGVNYTWYKVVYNGMTGYLRGDCVRVCTADGGYLEDDEPTPTPTGSPDEGESLYGYIKLNTGNRVNLRQEPLGKSLGLLDNGTVLPVVGEPTPYGLYGKYVWYPVRDAKDRFGWIRGDCVMECDQYGNELSADEPTTPNEEELPDLVGVSGKILKNAHLRQGTSTDSESLTVMPANTLVAVLYIPEDTKDGWYKVSYNGETGYVHASLIEVILTEDKPEPISLGYIMVTGDRVAIRKAPAGIELTRVNTGTVWPIIGDSLAKDGALWFNVRVGSYEGYIHSDYAFKLSPEQEESYLAGNGVPDAPAEAEDEVFGNYLITVNTKGLNIRESASQDSTSYGRVPSGVVMQYFTTRKVGTVTWYCVLYEHQERWVHGGYIEEMTEAEYRAWAAENPEDAPDKDDYLGYLKTNQGNVYVRNAANGSERVCMIADKGTVMRYYSEMIYAGGAGWYRVLTPDSGYAYIRDDLIEKCDENGDDLPNETPDIGDTSNAPQSQQETSYTTLRLGDGGTDAKATKVRNLVQELKNQGYYTGKVTDVYTSDVKAAVEVFQAAKGLYVDGIAGSATQHALFGTVPIGAGNTDNLDFTIYPAEKIDWFTGGIQDMIPRGANFKVYDVKTGIVWWAHRWAGGNHADIETLTAADSARLCQIYGVKNLQEIVDKNLWQRRPCLVTIGTRTFACSLDGMQHNPAGDTIPNNGMTGQICLHFTNSMGHENPKVSTSHAEAIEYAYNNCPAGQK